ncbi:MAG: hypothetical protein QHI48_12555 [Bacteroidota bacterium]|nr:hypothetical protein [Bacteroidota bacterium]
MNERFLSPLCIVSVLGILLCGCAEDVSTESLSILYGPISVTMEKKDGKTSVAAEITVQLVNRTEHAMNVAFLEGTIYDAGTGKALARFRPIIPQSYGTISTGQLLPKQVKDFTVITPPELEAFPGASPTTAAVQLNFQTTDGYRTEVVSGSVPVVFK